jgi:hypothetical protein
VSELRKILADARPGSDGLVLPASLIPAIARAYCDALPVNIDAKDMEIALRCYGIAMDGERISFQ